MLQKLKVTLHNIVYFKNRNYLENFWATAAKRKANWAEDYQESWRKPLRQSVVAELADMTPQDTLLELGCNAGPNIIAIMKTLKNPPKIHGIDINETALKLANDFFKSEGWNNITTERGVLPEVLNKIPSASFDTVMAIAVLMHLSPESFAATVKEMQRVSKKRIVIVDMHPFSNFFNCDQKMLPSGKFVERWEHNWWNVLDRSMWQVRVSELNPESTMSDVGDVNAIIVANKKQ